MNDLTPFIELSNPIISTGKTGGYRFRIEVNEKRKSVRKSIIDLAKIADIEGKEFRGKVVFSKVESIANLINSIDTSNIIKVAKWQHFINLVLQRNERLKHNYKARYTETEKNLYKNYLKSK